VGWASIFVNYQTITRGKSSSFFVAICYHHFVVLTITMLNVPKETSHKKKCTIFLQSPVDAKTSGNFRNDSATKKMHCTV
jgi:hypothetical protein